MWFLIKSSLAVIQPAEWKGMAEEKCGLGLFCCSAEMQPQLKICLPIDGRTLGTFAGSEEDLDLEQGRGER